MKKSLLLVVSLSFLTNMNAQMSLPNMAFEQWTTAASGRYENPSGGIWATPNPTLDALPAIGLPEAPVKKESAAANVHGGSFAAKLKTITIFGLKAAGTVYTGAFVFNSGNPTASAKLGVPFTARPDRFQGWLKYAPVNGDSCLVYARFIRKNTVTNQREQVGIARKVYTSAVPSFIQFDLPVVYNSTETPDSIILVCTSSAAAENLNAPQAGSTLYIDDLALVMPNATTLDLGTMISVQTFPNPATEKLTITTATPLQQAKIAFYAPDGKLVAMKDLENGTTTQLDLAELPAATYMYNIWQDKKTIGVGKVTIQH